MSSRASASFSALPAAPAIDHVERDLAVKHVLRNGLQRQQLNRLLGKLFHYFFAPLGGREKTSSHTLRPNGATAEQNEHATIAGAEGAERFVARFPAFAFPGGASSVSSCGNPRPRPGPALASSPVKSITVAPDRAAAGACRWQKPVTCEKHKSQPLETILVDA